MKVSRRFFVCLSVLLGFSKVLTVTKIRQEKTNQDRTKIGPFFDEGFIIF